MENSGLQFDFSYAPGTTFEQMIAFETAGQLWSNYIDDDMTVNIHVEMTNALPDNVIGGALPAMEVDINYAEFRDVYEKDITSGYDRQYFDSLSLKTDGGIEQFDALVDVGLSNTRQSSSTIDMTRANAKALGLVSQHSTDLDGYILMNDLSSSSVDWRYDISKGISDARLDYYSVALHEIGHVLGFVSGIDRYDPVRFNNWAEVGTFYNGDWSKFQEYKKNVVDAATPLDMFRYSQRSLDISYNFNTIDLSVGANSYFGAGELKYQFASGKDTSVLGDGFQASHWKEKRQAGRITQIGIMDPLMSRGGSRFASDRDVRAMDVIGYDLSSHGQYVLSRSDSTGQRMQLTDSKGEMEILSKEHIAKSMSSNPNAADWWVDWWMDNKPEYADRYINSDRTEDVQEMIEESQVYEGRNSSSNRSSRRSYSQEAFWQSAYFNEFSWQEFQDTAVESNLFIMSLSYEDNQNIFMSDSHDETAANTPENDVVDASVYSTAMNLLIIDEEQSLTTVSTDIKTELTAEASLYSEQLIESNLVQPLV